MTNTEAIERIKEFGLYHALGDMPHSCKTVEAFKKAIKALEEEVEVIRKKGQWIEYIPGHGKCPFCGNQVDLLGGKNNFCGECGADMRSESVRWAELGESLVAGLEAGREVKRMDGSISRQAAIEAVENALLAWSSMSSWREAKIVEAVADLPSVQAEQQWTSSGKKPPEEGKYLVWMPFAPPKHRIAVAEYCGGYWNIKTPISAWMPLPEPYTEEKE